ncbi:hypothetical protein RchiOBHm_Chr5g0048931 [Rosa chinensis]|uniref:Uncharacterized protein n=1 Tax=Rosa chinensis TaxID=74649 RepID=A0A2P6QET0_ROSCH|nr:hypothetical protein RchiOBHm_Chr5g0048931 [Rosa chinensis]
MIIDHKLDVLLSILYYCFAFSMKSVLANQCWLCKYLYKECIKLSKQTTLRERLSSFVLYFNGSPVLSVFCSHLYFVYCGYKFLNCFHNVKARWFGVSWCLNCISITCINTKSQNYNNSKLCIYFAVKFTCLS